MKALCIEPVKEDVFISATMFMPSLEFIRDETSDITGFKLNADGVYNLVFEKVPHSRI